MLIMMGKTDEEEIQSIGRSFAVLDANGDETIDIHDVEELQDDQSARAAAATNSRASQLPSMRILRCDIGS